MPAISHPADAPSASSQSTSTTSTTATTNTSTTTTLPIRKHTFPTPKLRLHLNDLSHEGSSIFLSNTKGGEDLSTQIQNVLNLLYSNPHDPAAPRPGTRSVTLVLRPMDGVAYTTGTELDPDHKEIHLNCNYLTTLPAREKNSGGPRDEILGVICHELVHCFQWNARGTCPGGLIEGIADWVRLRAGLAARHWRQSAEGRWDAGYQQTGYFLDFLEGRFGEGTVRKMNAELREGVYVEERLFRECCGGREVGELWREYGEELKKKEGDGDGGKEDEAPDPVPTHGVLKS